ncbi:hypothetical protein [Flindersiella endophytica]
MAARRHNIRHGDVEMEAELFQGVPVISGTNRDEQRMVTGIQELPGQTIADEQ